VEVRSQTPGWWIGLGFAGLAALLGVASPKMEIPVAQSTVVSRDQLVPGPRRHAKADPPTYVNGGYEHRCNSCHRLFRSGADTSKNLIQHKEVVLNHGLNNRCYNCHDRKDREKLVLMRGVLSGFSDATLLCAKCHGPVYRDWQNGTHGKTLNTWQDTDQRRRLNCTECHDPHSPAYPRLVPLPSPNTLRMGEQAPELDEEPDRSPLRHVPGRAATPAPRLSTEESPR